MKVEREAPRAQAAERGHRTTIHRVITRSKAAERRAAEARGASRSTFQHQHINQQRAEPTASTSPPHPKREGLLARPSNLNTSTNNAPSPPRARAHPIRSA